MSKKKTTNKGDFKSNLEELTALVETMEKGDLTLEKSLEYFERGVTLTKECQTILQTAEQKIKILTQKKDDVVLDDFKE